MAHVLVAKNDADRCGEILIMFSKKTGIYTIVLKNVNFGEENIEANILAVLLVLGLQVIYCINALYISMLYEFFIMDLCFYNQEEII